MDHENDETEGAICWNISYPKRYFSILAGPLNSLETKKSALHRKGS